MIYVLWVIIICDEEGVEETTEMYPWLQGRWQNEARANGPEDIFSSFRLYLSKMGLTHSLSTF